MALGVLHFASPERDDSLAAMIAVISAPSGSDLNPVDERPVPAGAQVPERGAIEFDAGAAGDRTTSSCSRSRRGHPGGGVGAVGASSTEQHPREVNPILDALSRGRLEPGRLGASPVAVNLVWLLAHTTVKAKAPRIT